jgi:uncharacterized membrane protein
VKTKEPRKVTDRQVELLIGMLLRVGVIVAASVAFVGGVWFLVGHGAEATSFTTFHGEPSFLRSVSGIVTAAIALHPSAVVQLGLLLLIAVPIFRVAVSIIAFAAERDWVYCVVTLLVLSILLFSLLGGTA